MTSSDPTFATITPLTSSVTLRGGSLAPIHSLTAGTIIKAETNLATVKALIDDGKPKPVIQGA